jgi:integrase
LTSLADRFEAKVDRTGDHHVWTGSKRSDGTGHIKVDGRPVVARRVAWELTHGPLPPGVNVRSCPDDKSCVRVEHLALQGDTLDTPAPSTRRRASRGTGSMREIRAGVWKLTITRGRYADGTPRRSYRTVEADSEAEAAREKAAFLVEVHEGEPLENKDDRDLTVNQAVERYLEEHLRGELGREERTIRGYRQLHEQWFAPEIGERRLRDVDYETMVRRFGKMRRAGLSRSRMNNAKSLYQPLFEWAERLRVIRRSPMLGFKMPKSSQVARSRTPPEVDQVSLLLGTAVEKVPDVAPVLTLGAVTGMRRGELTVLRWTRLRLARGELVVDAASDVTGIKHTKTDGVRVVSLDPETVAMLARHRDRIEERAAQCGVELAPDAFMFSLEPDCSAPMPADYVTKRVAVLKEHLGIEDKRPETVALEDEALRLARQPWDRPPGRRGPAPKGGMSYAEIGRRLGRSSRWAALAVASAQRREDAGRRDDADVFDGSILALRKFTSSELLDAGFNISAVAERQGHGPHVLAKHYSKARRSADRKAAEHLGRLVHRPKPPDAGTDAPSL